MTAPKSCPCSVDEIRQAFLDFFATKGCLIHPSSSLVPENDPTTLFTVAGMSQFKDLFLGRGTKNLTKVATCQKCIRTNDILNVGRTARHHTFFEMLGNFSFDAYFKREAILWAWEFLTQWLKLDPERLWVSVHTTDDEAEEIWIKEIGLPKKRIVRLGDHDNFWPADAPTEGPTGPGGFCSEIFWDYQTNQDPKDSPAADTGRFVEVWNLVFAGYNVSEPKVDCRYTLQSLGKRNIDTGMGLERIACVVQGKRNNFDIDSLQVLVQAASLAAKATYVMDSHEMAQREVNALIRRIADHVRAVSFCIADGALPSNTGRGYIVRRLIRRATLDLSKLGVEDVVLSSIVPSVIQVMGNTYPELARRQDLIEQTLQGEEKQFRKTLGRGIDLLKRAMERHRAEGRTKFSGDDAFDLFTTYGFPVEITQELAQAEGFTIDLERFQVCMKDFAEVSKGGKEIQVFTRSDLMDAKPTLGATKFVGYHEMECDTRLTFLESNGIALESADAGTKLRFALDVTPFYAESGGQVHDLGVVLGEESNGDVFLIEVHNVQKDDGLFIHEGTVLQGTARLGPARAKVENQRRRAIARHHSATHLLHAALTAVLGPQVEQQGSKVDDAMLRFDFNHAKGLMPQELEKVQEFVLEAINADHEIEQKEMAVAEAVATGAKALFGEKYGAKVRVIGMGPVSKELCGGTHVHTTGDIRAFRILREEATAAGIRRITAVAGSVAQSLEAEENTLAETLGALLGATAAQGREISVAAKNLKVGSDKLVDQITAQLQDLERLAKDASQKPNLVGTTLLERLESLAAERKRLGRLGEEQRANAVLGALDDIIAKKTMVQDLPVHIHSFDGADAKALKALADAFRVKVASGILVLGSVVDGKVQLLVSVSPDLVKRGLQAGKIVGELAKKVDGGGGGRPDLAQAGGKNPALLPAALTSVAELLQIPTQR